MAEHTPGPWFMADSNSVRRIVQRFEHTPILEATKQSDGTPDLHFANGGPHGADASMVVAAPAMYEALQEAAQTFREYARTYRKNGQPVMANTCAEKAIRCENALAQAEGDEPAEHNTSDSND